MRKGIFIALFFLAGVIFVSGKPPDDFSRQIDVILGRPALKRVILSVCVVRSDTGEVVYERNPHLALLPASNMKIVTSAAALDGLGPEFAFVTRVGLCGHSLVVIGSGDPLFGLEEKPARVGLSHQRVIQDIIARLKEMNVDSVSDIVLDGSVFDGQRTHPSWPRNQLVQRYACEVCGLNYNGNCVAISALNEKGRVLLSLDPPSAYVRLVNEVYPSLRRDNWFSVSRTSQTGQLLIRGKCATRAGPYSVAVENPALFFGWLLKDSLSRNGIKVGGEVLERPFSKDCELRPVADFRTPILDCLERMNKDSLSLAAEAVFKTLGSRSNPNGEAGSWEGGSRAASGYLRNLGAAEGEFAIADGCGLSRENRLSASSIVRVLHHLSAGPYWEMFKRTLAVGGLDGTIKHQFWEKKYRGRIRAKSGYIQAVRALSGVVSTDRGDFIFSFLANRAGGGAGTAIDAAVKAIISLNSSGTTQKSAGVRGRKSGQAQRSEN